MSTNNNEFGAVRIMFDYACYWGIPYDIRQLLEKEISEYVSSINIWHDNKMNHIGGGLLFRDERLGLILCQNGGNMRRKFWGEILPKVGELMGSIIFVHANAPSSFRELRWILRNDYSYDPEFGCWGLFMSPPVIAFVNTHKADAWSMDDIKLYLREYPDLNCVAFEPDNLFAVTSLLIYTLEHCASYILD